MQNYSKSKYDSLYMDLAIRAREQSLHNRLKVGACIVTKGGLISLGWNGSASGFPNECSDGLGNTRSYVLHAEHNAIKKLLIDGVSVVGSSLFVTTCPCKNCARLLLDLGLNKIRFLEFHKELEGFKLLKYSGVDIDEFT